MTHGMPFYLLSWITTICHSDGVATRLLGMLRPDLLHLHIPLRGVVEAQRRHVN